MRQVLSISLSSQTMATIRQKTKKRGFESVSGYIKHLLALDEDLISEEQLLKAVRCARVEYSHGTVIKANSIAELL